MRPVRSAARVGEQSAVVWKRLYLSPPLASRSAVGVWMTPPKALEAPNPTSSNRTIRMLGESFGGRNGLMGGKCALGSLALNGRTP